MSTTDIGRGADSAKHAIILAGAGVFWTAMVGVIVFMTIWSALWFSVASDSVKETSWVYGKASVLSFFKKSSAVEVAGRKVNAAALVDLYQKDSELKKRISTAKAVAWLFAIIAFIPSAVISVVCLFLFSLIGEFMQQDEHVRGVRIIDSVGEFNKLASRNIRGVQLVERGWVKKLRGFK